MTRSITLSDFLTDQEIKQAMKLTTAKEVAAKIITPNLERINLALGQENDALYLAYACEYVFNQEKLK